MKRIGSYILILCLLASSIGCACGKVTGPEVTAHEKPDFVVLTDDTRAADALLSYFRAATAYVPSCTAFDADAIGKLTDDAENPVTREEAVKALAEDATIALLFDATLAAELEALGAAVVETPFECVALSFEDAGNDEAKKAVEKWLSGDEAAYLASKPELWK